jgi:PAS domain S-box-containing protein
MSNETAIELQLAQAQNRIEELEKSRGIYLGTMMKALGISLAHWTPDATLVYANEKYCEISGIQGDPIGKNWLDFMPANQRAQSQAFVADLVQNPRVTSYEHPAFIDGKFFHYRWVITPIFDEDGRLLEFQSAAVDVSERKQVENLLAVQRDLARLISANKSDSETLQACLQAALQVSRLDCGGIYLVNPSSTTLELVCHHGLTEAFVHAVSYYPENSPSAQMIWAGKILKFCESDLIESNHKQEGLRSLTVIPVQSKGQVVGCLNIGSHIYPEIPALSSMALETIAPEIGGVVLYLRTSAMQKQAEASLVEARDRLLEAQQLAHIGNWEWDIATQVLHWSDQVYSIFGVSPETFTPSVTTFENMIHPDDREEFMRKREQMLHEKQFAEIEHRILLADGRVRHVHERTKLVSDEQGSIIRVIGTVQDITERKEVEAALQKSSLILQETQSIAHLGSWTFDLKTGLVNATPEVARLIGCTPGVHSCQELMSVLHPDDCEIAQAAWAAALEDGLYDTQHRILLQGEVRWLRNTARIKFDDVHGTPVSALGITQDITDRKLVEEQSLASQNLSQATIDALSAHICVLDARGVIISVNQAWRIFADENPPGLENYGIGMNYIDISEAANGPDQEIAHLVASKMKDVLNNQINEYLLEYPCHSLVEPRWFQLRVRRFESLGASYLVVSHENVTARRLTEESLRQSERRLSKAQAIGRIGDWEIDILTGKLFYSDEMFSLLERDPALGAPELSESLNYLRPDQAQAMQGLIMRAIQIGEGWEHDMFINLPSGREAWHHGIGAVSYDKDGNVVKILGVTQDITERMQVEKELRASNERFAQIVSNISEIFWVDDIASGQNIYVSPAFDAIFGVSYESLEQAPGGFAQVIVPEDRQVFFDTQKRQRSGFKTEIQYRIQRPDGSLRWLRDKGSPIFDETGKIVRVVGIARDITDQVEAQRQLVESEERFRQIAESIAEVFWMYDNVEQRIIYLNPAYEKIWGRSVESLYQDSRQYIEVIAPEDRGVMFSALAKQAQGQATEMEYRIQRPDGSMRWIYDRSFPIFDKNGQLMRTAGIATDITERKEADIALRTSENRYRELSAELEKRVAIRTAEMQDLYDNAPIGYHSLDENGAILLINKTHADWLGYSRDEIIGRPFTDFLTPSGIEVFREQFVLFKERGSIRDVEFDLLCKNERVIPVLVSATAIYDENGEYVMSRSTVFDNTEQKEVDEVMRHANLELARAMRMKDEFLASMSHELRTPLTGILGLSESLQMEVYGPLTDRQKRSLSAIEGSGRHLLDLINDILDVSKIESGKLELEMNPCFLDEVCTASLQLINELAVKKRQKVQFNLRASKIALNGDARRLKQILVNLLSNAVKFTPDSGELGLDVSIDPYEKIVSIAVWDKGIGISAENLKRLFQPFVQLDSSLSRQQSGTGLGLVLSQRLVEIHGGSIQVESTPGQGSRFTVRLPYLSAQAGESPEPETPAVDPVGSVAPSAIGTLMIVDDNEINIQILADYLEASGYRVVSAQSGADFLSRVSHILPDLVLMDIQMPGMDGLEAIRHLRALPNERVSSLPVIAVTALAMPGDRQICIEAGANEYLSKPYRLHELRTMVEQFLN